MVSKKEKTEILKWMGYYNKKFRREATKLGISSEEYYEIMKIAKDFSEMEPQGPITFNIDQLLENVNTLYSESPNTSFELTINSYINPDIQKTLTFKNIYQFQNWVKKIKETIDPTTWVDSQGTTHDELPGVFTQFTYQITTIEGGRDSNARKESRTIEGIKYNFTIKQERIRHNNCGLECLRSILNIEDSCLSMRKMINSEAGSLLTINQVMQLYKIYKPNGVLDIHTLESDSFNVSHDNILFNKEHYSVITHAEEREHKLDSKVKHGIIYWDIETRKTEDYCMVGETKSYYLKDVILHAHVKSYRSGDYKQILFKTSEKSACRQFLDWLIQEGRDGRYYYLYAHNGGNFDTYFLMMNFTKEEAGQYTPMLRGTTIIKLEFGNNVFLDSYCFLTSSLHRLSQSFKVKTQKLKTFIVNGKELTNEQMCFYKPELTFQQFLDLEHTEPEFWKLYNEYCYVDCVALQQIWDKFSESYEGILFKFVEAAPHRIRDLNGKCKLRQSCTIGGLAQKILNSLNGVKGKKSYDYDNYNKFIGGDKDKHDFIMKNFKRGGISHCNKKGKHTEGVMSVDICSQYPASMMHMTIPSGDSQFVDYYDDSKHGFYILKNLMFQNSKKFKPICEIFDTGVLNWITGNTIARAPLDSYMIKYLKEHYGLVSFDVEKGLVSKYQVDGVKIFGDYVKVLFAEKALQDEYKKICDEKANNAYRETIKLFLNAVTGKLVMNKEKYTSLKFSTDDDVSGKFINGVKYVTEATSDSMNNWVIAGVMVYSYSKRLLFEYIRQMPNNSDDVIHVETDSIYFPIDCESTFNDNIAKYTGSYPVKYGDELGNIKVEKRDSDVCYFLNKKVYTIDGNYIWKGIPKKTIADDGTEINILCKEKYEAVYSHKKGDLPITIDYMTMTRRLFGETAVSGHRQTRTMNSTYDYSEY
jgi:hypothetical protein